VSDRHRPIVAVVLAGRRGPEDPVARAGGRSCKALVPIAGRPMIEWVVEALEGSGRVGQIAVCIDPATDPSELPPGLAERLEAGSLLRLDAAASPVESVLRALDRFAPEGPLLVSTGDHPLLTPDSIAEFVDAARSRDVDLAAALVPASCIDAAYPSTARTRLRFRDGAWTGANLFVLFGDSTRNLLRFWRRMETLRKRPWRMALTIGPVTVVQYLMGRLTLAAALDRIGRRAGTRIAAIPIASAEAGIDVDSLADFELAERILSTRHGGGRR